MSEENNNKNTKQTEAEEPSQPKTTEHMDGCACSKCDNLPLTEEEKLAIERDPATGSLSHALKGAFFILKIAMLVLLLFFIIDRFKSVDEGNIMVVERFGQYITDDGGAIKVFEPGHLYFIWPEPIEKATPIPISEVKTLQVGTGSFWPRLEGKEIVETKGKGDVLAKQEILDPEKDGYNITGDMNILHTLWQVKYRISNYRDYLMTSYESNPEEQFSAIVKNSIIRNFASVTVDNAYYGDRRTIFENIDEDVRRELHKARLGIELDGSIVNIDIKPPGFTQAAFDRVTSSLSEKKKLIDAAKKKANTTLKTAETEALNRRNDAIKYQVEIAARAEAEASRLRELIAKFPNDPQGLTIYLQQYRYDRLQKALANARIYLMSDGENIFRTSPVPDYIEEQTEEKK